MLTDPRSKQNEHLVEEPLNPISARDGLFSTC